MSTNCIDCVVNRRTSADLRCDTCRCLFTVGRLRLMADEAKPVELDPALCKALADAGEFVALVNALRDPEGHEVSIPCDNPDFNSLPDYSIYVCGDFTGWRTQEFSSDKSVLDCLRQAHQAMLEFAREEGAR